MKADFNLEDLDKSLLALIHKMDNCKNFSEIKEILKIESGYIQNLINLSNFDDSKITFDHWLLNLFNSESIPEKIKGLYFGIFETQTKQWFKKINSFKIYISGSKIWSKDDSDWATNYDYSPKNRYIDLEIMKTISDSTEENIYLKYFFALSVSYIYIKSFFEEYKEHPLFKNNSYQIGLGFDDGDLYNLFKFPSMQLI